MVPTCSRYSAATLERYIIDILIELSHTVTFYSRALSKVASSTIFKVFGMTQLGIELTTSHTPGEHSTTRPPDAVLLISHAKIKENTLPINKHY